jgi:beta-galactosidase
MIARITLVILTLTFVAGAADLQRTVQPLDKDWKFIKGDPANAAAPETNTADWRSLDLPHDWSIEGPYDAENPTGRGGGYLPSGVVWYRKTLTLPQSDSGKKVFVEFDGVMEKSEVFINGKSLGKRPYGYSSFRYELTPNLNFGDGKTNVLAVRADTSQQPASRWYSGGGIYRHVRLIVADPVHVDHWGSFITTPQVSTEKATVHAAVTVMNSSNQPRTVSVQTQLIAPDGSIVQTGETPPQSIEAGKTVEFNQDLNVASPKIWDQETPFLYQAVTAVRDSGKTIDEDVNSFGIRHFEFKTDTGFWLNGRNFKLLGVCLHHDGGAVGAAVPAGVWEYRLAQLKKLGVNAIRTAHNPPDPVFLDVCDRMGFLVMDEIFDCWTVGKNRFDYHESFNNWYLTDTRDMVMRDRNHPSIVLYSAGNEIHDTPKPEIAIPILTNLVKTFHQYDPTRPVTQALFRPNVSHDYENGLADLLDVIGTNYRDTELLQAWKDKPGRKIIGTEQQHNRQTWLSLRDNPQHSGQFLWSGIDYHGESGWPAVTAGSGLLDRTGFIKPSSYERMAWWSTTPMVKITRTESAPGGGRRGGAPVAENDGGDDAQSAAGAQNTPPTSQPRGNRGGGIAGGFGGRGGIAGRAGRGGGGGGGAGRGGGPVSNWTRPAGVNGGSTTLTVFSNCDSVELFLNDKSLGAKPKNADDSPRTWTVDFAPGTIKAVGSNAGKQVAVDELKTAGAPAKVQLTVNKNTLAPTWDDVAFVTAEVVDANGVVEPYASNDVTFTVSGPGVVAAVDNGDRSSHEVYNMSKKNAFNGRVVALIKASAAGAPIEVTATAPGLTAGTTTIQTKQ